MWTCDQALTGPLRCRVAFGSATEMVTSQRNLYYLCCPSEKQSRSLGPPFPMQKAACETRRPWASGHWALTTPRESCFPAWWLW